MLLSKSTRPAAAEEASRLRPPAGVSRPAAAAVGRQSPGALQQRPPAASSRRLQGPPSPGTGALFLTQACARSGSSRRTQRGGACRALAPGRYSVRQGPCEHTPFVPRMQRRRLGRRFSRPLTFSCRPEPSLLCHPPWLTLYVFRQTTQDAPEEVRNRDFRRELEERELLLEKKIGIIQLEEEDEDEDFEEESDDDGTAALLAELERIKKERAEEQARKNSQRCSVIHIKKSKNQLILQHQTTKTNLTGWHRSYLPQEESGGGQRRRRACADLGRASALPLPPGPQRPRRSRLAAPPSSERPREH
ncbi:Spliceosome-associated protein CWC15 [Manis javanica]|nr:Spliceosome-associated protein CWC15 [Manis javanica]